MREIKFRSWIRKGNGYEMHYDCPLIIENRKTSAFGDFPEEEYLGVVLSTPTVGAIKAIMQYTGLKDKNGKEIYEGDIIGIKLSNGKYASASIEWNNREACFGCKWDSNTARVRNQVNMPNLPGNLLMSSGNPWGVIGNIYESKELLGQVDQ